MKPEGIIRTQSRQVLKGNWVAAVSGLLTLMAFGTLGDIIYSLLILLSGVFTDDGVLRHGAEVPLIIILCSVFIFIFALTPIVNGFFRLFYKLSDTGECDLREIFYFFCGTKNYFSALIFNALMMLRRLLLALIGFSPYILFLIITNAFSQSIYTSVSANEIMNAVAVVLICLGIATSLVLWLRLTVYDFLFAGDASPRPFYDGRRILRKHYFDLVKLFFTFIPWILLCFYVLPMFYVVPYFMTSFATSVKWLFKLNKEGTTV